ncbi:AAA family ATPase [Pelagibaculum spongiae]|uniref:ATPase dynein-related AAA domain-containing protein n=1 Tax=Pelagibaculum spongiae TaxID=2080658 RepID=A0A2V1GR03_9GAMM|nr:AAA family ATPase [Pelagibaculum spongiae]PVZ64502.1 hypothetical protein DC094_19510 [Pelagibaculum spongiae]
MARKKRSNNDNRNQAKTAKDNNFQKAGFFKTKTQQINNALAEVLPSKAAPDMDTSAILDSEKHSKTAEESLAEVMQLIETLKHETNNYQNKSAESESLVTEFKEKEQQLNEQIASVKRREATVSDQEIIQQKKFAQQKEVLALQTAKQAELKAKLDQLQADATSSFANERLEALELKQKQISELDLQHQNKLEQRQNALAKREAGLLEQEADYLQRKENADAGFFKERQELLQYIAQEKQKLQDQKETLEQYIRDQEARHSQKLASSLQAHKEQVSAEIEVNQQQFQNKRLEIERQIDSLRLQKSELSGSQQLLEQRQNNVKSLEQQQVERIRSDFASEIAQLSAQLEQEQKNREKDRNKIVELQQQLVNFKDLQRSLENENIEDIQSEIDELRKTNKELKTKLYSSDENLEEKCEFLEEKIDEQRDEIADLTSKYLELKQKQKKQQLSALEKHQLQKEKYLLEKHNAVLDSSIKGLSQQLDELVEKQQGSQAFPQLKNMDHKHRNPSANLQPVPPLREFIQILRQGMASELWKDHTPLYYQEHDVRVFLAGLAMSRLHILQGMSGTGKTSLAKAFTRVVGGSCTDISVQAGWRDKDDLLGHYNAFERKFYESEALQALYKAQLPTYSNRVNVILLDEMNLSRPEQYFADFNGALEKDIHDPDRNVVLLTESHANAPKHLLENRKIKVPGNVWFIGTANHDETTNEFADKTYDRAHVMELSRNAGRFVTPLYDNKVTYDFNSLIDAFDNAQKYHEKNISEMLDTLTESPMKTTLEEIFSTSWGNRLDRHAKSFVSVFKESGGSYEQGLDHLLATKLFRNGKAMGRFDISMDDLKGLRQDVVETWELLGLEQDPKQILSCIDKDIQRMERGA